MRSNRFQKWWLILIKGSLLILLGLTSFVISEETSVVVNTIVGISIISAALISVVTLLFFTRKIGKQAKSILFVEAVMDALIGTIILYFPTPTFAFLISMLGIWLLLIGSVQIIFAVQVRQVLRGWLLFLFNGLLTISISSLIVFQAYSKEISDGQMVGYLAIVSGSLLILGSVILKRWGRFIYRPTP